MNASLREPPRRYLNSATGKPQAPNPPRTRPRTQARKKTSQFPSFPATRKRSTADSTLSSHSRRITSHCIFHQDSQTTSSAEQSSLVGYHSSLASVFFIKKRKGRRATEHSSLVSYHSSLVTQHCFSGTSQDCCTGQSCSLREPGLSADFVTA